MDARIDHVVIWVDDPLRALEFYEQVVGLSAVRAEEFRDGKAPFPSVRVSGDSLIDIMRRAGATNLDNALGVPGSAGNPINHVCLALSRADYEGLRGRLDQHGVKILTTMEQTFGARGLAHQAIYFPDPDGNVIEARYYA